ncbi:cation-translocating P-type ATPase [Lacrimispora xylanolytica]|uniref:Cation-translocating P-type ATPase n=1 Tax=Lacrimispora xylanolytica TaxID=29375 RepID=A0ABY7AF95_9FIRM|nr:cation-translocating P-type ATPase [Lacrimispora xylanolytica]WAJ25000.1 cation-translocating P-type ATPase [Lacrimispora xylanolytica]
MQKEYLMESTDVLKNLETSTQGLSSAQVEERKSKYGLNKLKEGVKPSLIQKFFNELINFMNVVLIIAAVISGITSLYVGESMIDTVIILLVVTINAALGVYQESKAEAAIEALQDMAAATSNVIRNDKIESVRSEDLVPGDIILLEAGDAVPADSRLIECASLKVEEAALTGESTSVTKTEKTIGTGFQEVTLGDRKNMVYTGSTIVYGRGKAVVCYTGMDTEIGRIADAINTAKEEETPLQLKLNQLSKALSIMVLAICAVMFATDIARILIAGGEIHLDALIDTFMIAVSLAVAAIPEGLAAVVTILLSIGVTKMSKEHAIIRKLTAVETLGCTQIICSDKTGTLTQNKMTVVEHSCSDEKLLMTAMSLCSDAEIDLDTSQAIGEPTECALVNDAFKNGLSKPELAKEYVRVAEAPFDSVRKMMSTLHKKSDGTVLQFTKGAPDEVLKRCSKAYVNGNIVEMTEELRRSIIASNKQMADKALRVLCASMKEWSILPSAIEPGEIEHDLIYLGLSGMIDPVRPEVKFAIVECKEAGIRAIMITGDHKDTAVAIAKELGILEDESMAITGAELNKLSEEELEKSIQNYSVYARVQPEHKVRIVKTWKKLSKVTAMTGDGVNDAPSIKEADIGVGMGITGTDVTKDVADMVLADDNFATIVSAVAEGRRIYDNIRKAIQFLLSSNLAEVIAVFIASLLGFTILKPVHLLWINLITDCFPAIGIGMEEQEADIMKRNPRNAGDGIFADGVAGETLFQGAVIGSLTLLAYFVGHYMESGLWEIAQSADGMTMAFLSLSLLEMFHSFNMRSRHESIFRLKTKNKFLFGSLLASFVLTTAVIYVPFLRRAFEFEHISLTEYFVAILIAVSIIPIMEVMKLIRRNQLKNK